MLDTERAERVTGEARKVYNIRCELIRIYKVYPPGKITAVDLLLEKYAGREADLIKAVKKKYSASESDPAPENWSYVLKNYPTSRDGEKKSLQQQTWAVEQSIGTCEMNSMSWLGQSGENAI